MRTRSSPLTGFTSCVGWYLGLHPIVDPIPMSLVGLVGTWIEAMRDEVGRILRSVRHGRSIAAPPLGSSPFFTPTVSQIIGKDE